LRLKDHPVHAWVTVDVFSSSILLAVERHLAVTGLVAGIVLASRSTTVTVYFASGVETALILVPFF